MNEQLFPYANIVTGTLVFIVGFLFHWVGQLISIINWELAEKIGLQEKKALPEFKVYEHGTAAADVLLGWIYGIAAVGVLFNLSWAYKLLWFPGVVMIYHALCFWFYTGNQNKIGHPTIGKGGRVAWFLANMVTGILAISLAW